MSTPRPHTTVRSFGNASLDYVYNQSGAQAQMLQWIMEERRNHSSSKYENDEERDRLYLELAADPHIESEVMGWRLNYLKRVQLFGANTQPGKQALGKLIITLMDILEASIEISGPMPQPGVPSGELRDWVD